MFPPSNTDHKTQDRKLAAVAYLRENADANKHRLSQVKSILNGEEPLSYNVLPKEPADGEFSMSSGDKSRIASLRNRCIFCLILFILFFAAAESKNSSTAPYIQEIKSVISADYSDNLFDFLQQIPYTLDYEKINVKR